ncbi:MAG: DUF4159 domain-containing protein [Bacteroidetes bacterium]|nr:DUF4159 domain-containing protein [Bacteroidota bacterium]
MKKVTGFSVLILILLTGSSFTQQYSYQIAKLKYSGGGDWYANRTALPNLIEFCNDNLNTNIDPQDQVVEVGSSDIFNFPFVYMTGHGNVVFTDKDVDNLRKYLIAGGFLHIDDNYGLEKYVRPQMKKVFPELDFVELPFSHALYSQKFKFPNGLPKIHEHDGKPPKGYGLIYKGRLVCFFDVECDLGNGWEDYGIYGDSQETRQKALKMGANLVQYSTTY